MSVVVHVRMCAVVGVWRYRCAGVVLEDVCGVWLRRWLVVTWVFLRMFLRRYLPPRLGHCNTGHSP